MSYQNQTPNKSQHHTLIFGNAEKDEEIKSGGSRSLKGFIFSFLSTPFKVVTSTISNSIKSTSTPSPPIEKSEKIDSPNRALSRFFEEKGDEPLSEIEARGVMALLQESKTPEGSVIAEEINKNQKDKDPLPSAFTPNFRSLNRPRLAFPVRQTQSTSSLLFPTSTTPKINNHNSRRTFYMGPGHSIYNHSTRLNLLRQNKKKLGGRSLNVLSDGFDLLPKEDEERNKRRKTNGMFNSETIIIDNDEEENGQKKEFESSGNSSIKKSSCNSTQTVKNNIATPLRPSPLRNVTLPTSTSSSSPRGQSTTTTPKRKRTSMTSTLIKSAIKQVDEDFIKKSSTTSINISPINTCITIKKSEIINPYSNLERNKNKTKVKVKENNKESPEKGKERKRKMDIHIGKEQINQNEILKPANMGVEELLERTMPDEYREGNKRRKKLIGTLPDRFIKKKAALESKKQKNKPESTVTLSEHETKKNENSSNEPKEPIISSTTITTEPNSIINPSNNNIGLFDQQEPFSFGIKTQTPIPTTSKVSSIPPLLKKNLFVVS
ncbi:hypothetical protein CROQUDRAFT_555265 [Cronartium quercuum f. sp. fusiforme G11]|uniref:Uncharacterized protein n=1 Tax=Cronartium quercuum f. sp. fusiforme G11 TaxID=708437 RepID=A0A9P6NHL6_9BASI|nr:hypothetical protein CROQUDRAFT_555265 [Cronartium quercuum f. sp. fusiforme G11]